MLKIGIISRIKLGGPGTRNIIYKNPGVDDYTYIESLELFILDDDGVTLKTIYPKFDNKNMFFNRIVRYDTETNEIFELPFFMNISNEELDEIMRIKDKLNEILTLISSANKPLNFKLTRCQMIASSINYLFPGIKETSLYEKEFIIKGALSNIDDVLKVSGVIVNKGKPRK